MVSMRPELGVLVGRGAHLSIRLVSPSMSKMLREASRSMRVPKSQAKARAISHKSLRQKMSELISLRERVAQAELAAGSFKRDLTRHRKPSVR